MRLLLLCAVVARGVASAGPYAPAADDPGSTAVAYDSASIVGWATGSQNLVRGPVNISNPGLGFASHGSAADAMGAADATAEEARPVVSLGDGGRITVTFARPIGNGPGADFAVFENGVTDGFLELAFVDVSSDGTSFVRFHAFSLTQKTTQIGSFDQSLDATDLYNLAGKYRAGFGTPFDLSELAGTAGLDVNNVTHIRIQDVVGSINPLYGTVDSLGNLINDPWPTNFGTGGFDLDAVGVMHFAPVPEPSAILLLATAGIGLALRRRR